MRRVTASGLVALAVAAITVLALGLTGSAAAARLGSIVGRWSGVMRPVTGSFTRPHRLTVTVNRGETAGTWRISADCRGTLVLKDISSGMHHYTEIPAAGTVCRGGGVDCLERVASHVYDIFISAPPTDDNANGRLWAAG
jgi:hypothetical protein